MNDQTQDTPFIQDKERLQKAIGKKLTSFAKAKESAMRSLEEGRAHKEVQHLGELLKANFPLLQKGMREIEVADWKQEMKPVRIPLDPTATPQEILESLFQKSAKLKRSIGALEQYLLKLNSDEKKWREVLHLIERAENEEELAAIEKMYFPSSVQKKTTEKRAPRKGYYTFTSNAGIEILVGKSSHENDILTFQIARGNDVWLHAHSVSGSHVVIRRPQDRDIDPETLQDALHLALWYSKARSMAHSKQEVTVSERKYVSKRPKAPAGQVIVSNYKIISCICDKARIERLKSSL